MLNYPATLTKDGGTFLVTFRDIPEAITYGADKEEALLNAVGALETGISFYVDSRKPLPLPSKAKQGEARRSKARLLSLQLRWSVQN